MPYRPLNTTTALIEELGSFVRGMPRRVETPPPFGFQHNRGQNYVPFHIIRNRLHIPAHYTTLVMCDNPYVLGHIVGDTTIYGGMIEAEPDYDIDCLPLYTHDQLPSFHSDSKERADMDVGLHIMGDKSLTAEVHHYCKATEQILELDEQIGRLELQMFKLGHLKSASGRALERANVLARIDAVGWAPVSVRDNSTARREERRRQRCGRPT
jgi:hypothetical protein